MENVDIVEWRRPVGAYWIGLNWDLIRWVLALEG